MGIENNNGRKPIDLEKEAEKIADKVLFHVDKIIEGEKAKNQERIGKDGISPVKKQIEQNPKKAEEYEKKVEKLTLQIDEEMGKREIKETEKLKEKKEDKGKQEEEKLIAKVAEILKMEKSDLLKEKLEWLENFVKFINKTNNLSYVEEIEKKEKGGFNEEYFKEKWPNSMYAIADNIPFEIKIDLFKSGKIKDPAHIFTTEELKGELGKTKIKEKTIALLCAEQKDRANKTFTGIINANNDAIEKNLNLLNTPVGKTILHDYLSLEKFPNGRNKVNIIYNDLGYLATRAYGFDTFILFNKEKGYFSIRSRFPLKEIGRKFGVREEEGDVFIVSGPILNMTEKEFLDMIDKKILAREKELPEKKE